MKNLNDKTYRQAFIERYLDADTSIEEEKALADFYRHCKAEDLTEEELSIRNLILGLGNYTQTSASNELPSKTKVQTTSKTTSRMHSSKNSSIRISAILLAAAMIAGIIFLVFPVKNMFSNKSNLVSLAPTTQVVRSYQSPADDTNESLSPAEEMERQDSLFLAATKDLVVSSPKKSILSHHKIATKQAKENRNIKKKGKREEKEGIDGNKVQENTQESASNDFNHFYEVASLALPSADQLKIDKQGDDIIITTTDVEGKTQQFSIDTSYANEGLYQLQPLAQLNE